MYYEVYEAEYEAMMDYLYSEEAIAEEYKPDYDECGFNPYCGCYDYDC